MKSDLCNQRHPQEMVECGIRGLGTQGKGSGWR